MWLLPRRSNKERRAWLEVLLWRITPCTCVVPVVFHNPVMLPCFYQVQSISAHVSPMLNLNVEPDIRDGRNFCYVTCQGHALKSFLSSNVSTVRRKIRLLGLHDPTHVARLVGSGHVTADQSQSWDYGSVGRILEDLTQWWNSVTASPDKFLQFFTEGADALLVPSEKFFVLIFCLLVFCLLGQLLSWRMLVHNCVAVRGKGQGKGQRKRKRKDEQQQAHSSITSSHARGGFSPHSACYCVWKKWLK